VEAIEHPPIFHLPGIPDHVTYTWLVMIILAGVAFMATRRLELVPRGAQNAMEVVLEQIQGMIDDVMGPQGRPYLPFIATLGLFILTANLMSLVPGLAGPTTNLNTTAACALVVFFAYHAIGLRRQGVVTYIKHFMGPVWWLAPLMMPIEIISHLARVHRGLSLSAEDARLLPSGLHLRDADDAVHRGSHRARGGRSRRPRGCASRFRPSLAHHTYRGGRSCDVH